jgi:hypothetical protein
MGGIHLSCGHEVDSFDETRDVRYKGEDCCPIDGFVPTVFYAVYCIPCAEKLAKEPHYLATDAEADAWLDREIAESQAGAPNK